MARVSLAADQIKDWDTFHSACQIALGFPAFYGRNMNAWIDCLSYLDESDGMSAFTLSPDEQLIVTIPDALALRDRAPEVFAGLIESTAVVNKRYVDAGKRPVVALVLC